MLVGTSVAGGAAAAAAAMVRTLMLRRLGWVGTVQQLAYWRSPIICGANPCACVGQQAVAVAVAHACNA
jgi:hypothetical protein